MEAIIKGEDSIRACRIVEQVRERSPKGPIRFRVSILARPGFCFGFHSLLDLHICLGMQGFG